jgi:tetratricopeptide (TPR) repeat protein
MTDRYVASLLSIAGLLMALPTHSPAGSPIAVPVAIKESREFVDAGKWDEAGKLLEEQLKKTTNTVEVARLRAELAHYAADRNTYFQKNEDSVREAIAVARSAVQSSGDKQALTTLEMAEGRFTYFKALDKEGDWQTPTEHFDRALKTFEELGDDFGRAEAMFYRGLVYQMQDQDAPAQEIFDQGLELTKKTGNQRMQSFIVRHIAYLQQKAGDIAHARSNFQESLRLRQQNGMHMFVPFALLVIAELEMDQKNTAEAIKVVEEAIPLSKSGNSPRALYSAQLLLAELYADTGKLAEARNLGQQSRDGAKAFGDPAASKEAEDFLQKHQG